MPRRKRGALLDDLDRRLVSILQKDASRPYRELAKELGISVTTVCNRIRRLIQIGVIKRITAEVDYTKLGYCAEAFLGIQVQPQKIRAVLEELKSKREYVVSVQIVTGHYDIIAHIVARDTADLRDFLMREVYKIDGILRTETMLVVG